MEFAEMLAARKYYSESTWCQFPDVGNRGFQVGSDVTIRSSRKREVEKCPEAFVYDPGAVWCKDRSYAG